MARPFYYRETAGIRVTVRPLYLPERSRPDRHEYVFAYFVRIENVGPIPAQLLTRRWVIADSTGEETVVEGEGVVGQQPLLKPGDIHEYQSFCVLKSTQGHMEGQYFFAKPDGVRFAAEIPRFHLAANELNEPLH